jgi:D-alanyl-D-alanine carboxypeptidase
MTRLSVRGFVDPRNAHAPQNHAHEPRSGRVSGCYSDSRDSIGRATCMVIRTFLVLAALTFPPSPGWAAGGPDLARLAERFQAELDRLRGEAGFPGATAAFILADGRCFSCATGYADQEDKVRMRPDARMPAGSVGKTFVAAVALSLAQEGRLGLDDKIDKWLGKEDWFSRLPNGREITLRMLLTHSSGLTDHVYDPRFVQAVARQAALRDRDPDFYFTPRQLVEFVLDKPPLFAPGKGYSYSDTGYILAGMIIERATGSTYYEQLRKRFLLPLKLRLTVPADHREIPGLASGYMSPNNPLGLPAKTVADGKMVFNPASEWTGGGLASNPRDLVRWAKELYEGRVMAKPYLDELLTSGATDRTGKTRYGLGVSIRETEFGTAYGHGGWFPGYVTAMAYWPRHKVAVAAQINTDVNPDAAAYFDTLAKVVLLDSP